MYDLEGRQESSCVPSTKLAYCSLGKGESSSKVPAGMACVSVVPGSIGVFPGGKKEFFHSCYRLLKKSPTPPEV